MSKQINGVRFHPCLVTSISRLPTQAEQWALEDFEYHARICRACVYPYLKYLGGSPLCKTGLKLTRRLAFFFRERRRKHYSTAPTDSLDVVVEIPPRFQCCLEVLKSATWHLSQRAPRQKSSINAQRVVRQVEEPRCSYYAYYQKREIWVSNYS